MGQSVKLVFLIGAARSGTKYLRDTLAESEYVAAVPYDINYVWRHGHERLPDDRIPAEAASGAVSSRVQKSIERMAWKSKGNRTPIVIEKTVSNVFRVPYIWKLFDDAVFIHLVRDGRDVAESARRMWTEPRSPGYIAGKLRYFSIRHVRYGLWYLRDLALARLRPDARPAIWGPRYPGIGDDIRKRSVLDVAAKQWLESVSAALRGFESVPESRLLTVRYEDLVSGLMPIQAIAEFIGIPDVDRVLESHSKFVSDEHIGKWKIALSPAEQESVLSVQRRMLERLEYIDSTNVSLHPDRGRENRAGG